MFNAWILLSASFCLVLFGFGYVTYRWLKCEDELEWAENQIVHMQGIIGELEKETRFIKEHYRAVRERSDEVYRPRKPQSGEGETLDFQRLGDFVNRRPSRPPA